jgi:hypothetical protein
MLRAKYHSLVDNGTISRFGAVDDTEEEILQEQILNATKANLLTKIRS